MQSPEVVQSYIAAGIACSFLQVEGDGRHFDAIIVSDAFEGKRPKTTCKITPVGVKAFEEYVNALKSYIG